MTLLAARRPECPGTWPPLLLTATSLLLSSDPGKKGVWTLEEGVQTPFFPQLQRPTDERGSRGYSLSATGALHIRSASLISSHWNTSSRYGELYVP